MTAPFTAEAVGQTVSVMARSATGRRAYQGTLLALSDDGALSIEVRSGASLIAIDIPADSVCGGSIIRCARPCGRR